MSRNVGVVVFLVISSIIVVQSHDSTLRFVSVVFRHGDRAPDDNGKELYPKDPYLHKSFYPEGLGGLTNNGKRREFRLGEVLREKYNDFLGNVYIPDDIVARSTDYRRTKMSLLLVLAGLFPPAQVQRWYPKLQWQPIPTSYEPDATDVLLVPEECPRFIEELERVKSLPEVIAKVEEFGPLMKNLTIETGKPIDNTNDMWYLYHSLMAESSMGLALPKWAKEIFPYGRLLDGAILEYDIVSWSTLLKKLNGGTLLKRMSDDMASIIEGKPTKAKKMNLFSGHETNVASLLHTLGLFNPHVPEYSSGVIIELHTIGNANYVKVLRYLGIPDEIIEVQIPGCDLFCPHQDFLRILRDVTPSEEDLVCPKSVESDQPM